jgi:hypothetical protein
MRHDFGFVATMMFVAASLQGQQPAAQQPAPQQAPTPEAPNVIYRVDLEPTGTGFVMGKPVQEGDVWVMTTLPDRTVSRVPTAKVKKISRWSSDLNAESIWQIDLVPTGVMLSREEPVKKGALYTVKAFKGGTLASLREADVKKITRLTGMDAFKAQLIAQGAVLITTGPPPGPGGGRVHEIGGSPSSPAPAQDTSGGSSNWIYYGVPGASDAYAPGNATVARPGDTPMMPPAPTPK